MAGQLLLADLQSGKHETIGQDLENYLSPLLCGSDSTNRGDKSKYGLYAVKFLHTTVSQLNGCQVSFSLLQSVQSCYHGYKIARDDVNLVEPLTVLKLLYHILTKLPQKGFVDSLLAIATCLYDELSYCIEAQTGTVEVVLKNTYSYLWNVAARCEQDQTTNAPDTILKLRHAALKTLLLGQANLSAFVEKYLVSFSRYDRVTVQCKEKDPTTSSDLYIDLTQDLISIVLKWQGVLTDSNIFSLLTVFTGLFKYILQRGLKNNVDDCRVLLDETKPKTSEQIVGVVCIIDYLFRFVGLLFTLSTGDNGKKSCLQLSKAVDGFNQLLERSFVTWPETGQQLIQDLITSLLKHMEGVTDIHTADTLQEIVKIGNVLYKMDVVVPSDKMGRKIVSRVENIPLCLRILFKYMKDNLAEDSLMFVDMVTELSALYNDVLESDVLDWSMKKLNQERHYCGYLMSKLGRMYSMKGDNLLACQIYTISCHQLTKWVKSDLPLAQQRLQEFSLWSVYECLSDCQKKSGNIIGAMETVLQCLLVDSSHVAAAVKVWARTKKEAIMDGNKDVVQMILGDMLFSGSSEIKLDICDVLNMELLAFRNNRRSYFEAEFAILRVMLSASEMTTVRARALLDIGQLMWLKDINAEKSVLDYIQEAEEMLAKDKDPVCCMLLGEVYLWSFIIQHESHCHQVFSLAHTAAPANDSSESSTRNESGDPEDDTNSRTSLKVQSQPMYTVTMETVAMEKLETAIELWENLLVGSDGLDNRTDPSILLATLMLCSSILRLSRRVKNELRVLCVAQQLVDMYPKLDRSVVEIRTREAHLLTGHTEDHGGATDRLDPDLHNLQGTQWDMAIQAVLLNIRQALHQNNLEMGMASLTSVISHLESKPCKTRSVCSAMGVAKRLMSIFLGQHQCPDHYRNNYALDFAIDAIRMHTGVVQVILGKEYLSLPVQAWVGCNSFDKWLAVEDLILSLMNLGQLYSLVGEDREARCYLREGWQLAHYICLPQWTMQFLIELARIHNLIGNIENTTSSVLDCRHILESSSFDRTPSTSLNAKLKTQSTDSKTLPGKKSVKRKLEDNFGFDTHDTDTNQEETTPEDLSSQLVLPGCYYHIVCGKRCAVCSDPWVSLLVLHTAMVVAQCQSSLGFSEKALSTVRDIQTVSQCMMSSEVPSKCGLKAKRKPPKKCTGDGVNRQKETFELDHLFLKEIYVEAVTMEANILAEEGDMDGCADVASKGLGIVPDMHGDSLRIGQLSASLHLFKVLSQCDSLFNTSHHSIPKDDSITNVSAMSADLFYNDEITQVTASMANVNLDSEVSNSGSAVSIVESMDGHEVEEDEEKGTDTKVTQKLPTAKSTVAAVEHNDITSKKPVVKKGTLLKEQVIISTPKRVPFSVCMAPVNQCSTPVMGPQYMYTDDGESLKTPRSVCSRRAQLDQMLDDSDEDICVKFARGKTTGRKATKKPVKKSSQNCEIVKTPKLVLLNTIKSDELVEGKKSKKPVARKGNILKEQVIGTAKCVQSSVRTSHLNRCSTPVADDGEALPIKTPRSVCSRRAQLDKMLDDSDDDTRVKSARGQTTGRKTSRKPGKKSSESCEVIKTPNFALINEMNKLTVDSDQGKKGRSRIPCRVRTNKLDNKDTKSNICTLDSVEEKRTGLDGKEKQVNEMKGRGVKKGNKLAVLKKDAQIECEQKKDDPNVTVSVDAASVYVFDESDDADDTCDKKKPKTAQKGKRKAAASKCASVAKGRVQSVQKSQKTSGREKARNGVEEDRDRVFSLTDCLDLPVIEEPLSPDFEAGLVRMKEEPFTDPVGPPLDQDAVNPVTVENILAEEMLDLNESIELPRADDKGDKKPAKAVTRKGRGRRKAESSVSDTGSTSGETTEVLRSTRMLNTKIPQITAGFHEPVAKVPPSPAVLENPQSDKLDVSVAETLERAFQQVRHLPSPGLYSRICHMKALQYLELHPLKAAFYLSEAIAVTFRHQAMVNAGKKIRKIKRNQTAEQIEVSVEPSETETHTLMAEKENQNSKTNSSQSKHGGRNDKTDSLQTKRPLCKLDPALAEDTSDMDRLRIAQESLQFTKTEEDLQTLIDGLPDGMVVCQLAVVSHPTHHSHLLVSRLEKNAQPIVVSLPGISSLQGQQILPEFSAVMEESERSLKLTKKAEWWRVRRGLDDRMHSLLDSTETYWLGPWKVLLLGSVCVTDRDRQTLTTVTDAVHSHVQQLTGIQVSKDKLRVLLQSGDYLTDQQLTTALCELTRHPLLSPVISELVSFIRTKCSAMGIWSEDRRPQHVILILDKTIQHLPWESIPILRRKSVSRVPSFYHMCVQLFNLQTEKSSIYKTGIDSRQTFYFLDPDGNLPSTRETFQGWFAKESGWKGIIGERPTADQFKDALMQSDLVIYCGHGSGGKYFHGDDLQQVHCHAAALLMGCSSGRLQVKGQLEASGMMLKYFLSGCPCIVSNLWDVTDRDIDRFLENLLSTCLAADKPCSLLDAIPGARDSCCLPYLIGSAPVVYGFPVYMKS